MHNNTDQEKILEIKIISFITVSVLLIFGISLFIYYSTPPIMIHFIDIGQGDSCFIQAGNGGSVLIDGGDVDSGESLESFFSIENVDVLDAVFISHFHEDHVLGIIELLENKFPISHIYFSEHPSQSEYEEKIVQLSRKNHIPITRLRANDTLTLGKVTYRVISQEPFDTEDNFNNMSMILRADYYGSSVLFTGDIENDGSNRLLDQSIDALDVDVLKIPHHGGASSANHALFKAASPEYSVISLGVDNPYGNPSPSALAYLLDVESKIYRTDRDGTISMTLGKKGIKNISYNR